MPINLTGPERLHAPEHDLLRGVSVVLPSQVELPVSVFAYATKHRLIATNPCAVVDKPRVAREERAFLVPTQVRAVAGKLDAFAPYGLIVRLPRYTGLREGELAALRIRDVNLLHRRVEVRRTLHRVKGGWEIGTPKSV